MMPEVSQYSDSRAAYHLEAADDDIARVHFSTAERANRRLVRGVESLNELSSFITTYKSFVLY